MTARASKSRGLTDAERRVVELGIRAHARELSDELERDTPDGGRLSASTRDVIERARDDADALLATLDGATRIVIELGGPAGDGE